MNFWGICFYEAIFVGIVMLGLGFLKAPRFLMKRKLVKGFPWGYYADQVPQGDPNLFPGNSRDFLHDTGTSFGGPEGFGDFGEFSGFGQQGEFGSAFTGGDVGGGGGGGE